MGRAPSVRRRVDGPIGPLETSDLLPFRVHRVYMRLSAISTGVFSNGWGFSLKGFKDALSGLESDPLNQPRVTWIVAQAVECRVDVELQRDWISSVEGFFQPSESFVFLTEH